MSVTIESSTGSGVVSGVSSITFSHTVTSANLLIVTVGVGDTTFVISSVTYNGTSMSLVDSQFDRVFERSSIYSLASPSVGSNNVVVTFNNAINHAAAGATGFIGASATLGTPSKTSGTSANPSLTVVDSASGDIVIAILSNDNSTGDTSVSGGNQEWEVEDAGSDSDFSCQSKSASGANTSINWTQSSSGSGWAVVGVAIKSDSAGPGAGSDTSLVGVTESTSNLITVSITEETS